MKPRNIWFAFSDIHSALMSSRAIHFQQAPDVPLLALYHRDLQGFFSSLIHWFDCSHLWAVENRADCEHTGSVCLSPSRLWEGWSWDCWVLGTWALSRNGDGVSIITVLQPEQLELLKTRQCLLSAESL